MNLKRLLRFFTLVLLTLRAGAEPIEDFLFPPDLIVRAKEEVKLSDEQLKAFRDATEKMETRFRELQERLKVENDAFIALVKPGHVDATAALVQLDKFLDAEREMKRAQIGFMLSVKNVLTPEQQAKLTAFRNARGLDRASMEEFQKRIVTKAERVRVGVEKLAARGGDTGPLAAIMEEVRTAMEQGRPKDAEAAIDRALKELEGK